MFLLAGRNRAFDKCADLSTGEKMTCKAPRVAIEKVNLAGPVSELIQSEIVLSRPA